MSLSISSVFQSTYSTLRAYAFNHKASLHPERVPGLDSTLEIRHEAGNQVEPAKQAHGPWRQPTLAAQIPLKTKPVVACGDSPNATGLAVAEERSDSAKTLQRIYTSGSARTMEDIALSPNQQWLAACTGRKIELWSIGSTETAPPRLLRVFSGNFENVTSVAFSPDSQWLAAGKADGSAQMWSTQTDAPTFKTFSYLPTLRQVLNRSTPNHVAFSPDGKWLLGCNGNVSIWSTTADRPARSWLPLNNPAKAIAFTPNGQYLAVKNEDCSVKIYSFTATDELEPLYELEKHSQEIESVAFSQEGTWLTSGNQGSTVKFWALAANTDISNVQRTFKEDASAPRI